MLQVITRAKKLKHDRLAYTSRGSRNVRLSNYAAMNRDTEIKFHFLTSSGWHTVALLLAKMRFVHIYIEIEIEIERCASFMIDTQHSTVNTRHSNGSCVRVSAAVRHLASYAKCCVTALMKRPHRISTKCPYSKWQSRPIKIRIILHSNMCAGPVRDVRVAVS